MENKDEIIEVEVTDEKLNAPKKEGKPKKTLDDYSSKIRFYGSLAYLGSRYGFTGMILAGLAGLFFSILYSENKATSFLALVIVCYFFSSFPFSWPLPHRKSSCFILVYYKRLPNSSTNF